MNKCFQLRRVKSLSFHKKLSEIKRKFIYFDKKTFSFKTQFSTKIPRNMKYEIFSLKKNFSWNMKLFNILLVKGKFRSKELFSWKLKKFFHFSLNKSKINQFILHVKIWKLSNYLWEKVWKLRKYQFLQKQRNHSHLMQ